MDFNKAMKQIKENGWNIDLETVGGKKYRGSLKWWDNYTVCVEFKEGDDRIFFKGNLVYVAPVKD